MSINAFNRIFSAKSLFLFFTLVTLSVSLNFGTAHAATYTITTVTDETDGDCGGDGDCSLRDAITAAGDNPGQDTIAIGGAAVDGTVTLGSNAPTISTDILDCDGHLTIDGNADTYKGLRLGTSATIKGCSLRKNNEAALYIDGNDNVVGGIDSTDRNFILSTGINLEGDNNTFINNYIGVRSDGSTCTAGAQGIVVQSGASDNVIGGDASNERNLISCQSSQAILIRNGAGSLTIAANYIGVNKDGDTDISAANGIEFESGATYASAITIGGSTNDEANLISGLVEGIDVKGTFSSTLNIKGNLIGTNGTGASAIANGTGISIDAASCGTLTNCVIERNTISGNTGDGILVSNAATKFQIKHNKIGVNHDGDTALANGGDGIEINTGTNILIGTTDTDIIDAPNVISGNTGNGIKIVGAGTSAVTLSENYIGYNSAGTAVIANGGDGVHMDTSGTVTIGNSATSNTMNIIVGNTDDGIEIASNAGAIGIYANGIGAVNSDLGNGDNGIEISGTPAAAITIGNAYATGGNHIAGNDGAGIFIDDAGSQSHVIKGNRIGVSKTAAAALANTENGILIQGSNPNITIGSETSGEYNIIGGNTLNGINLNGIAATVIGNYIGMNTTYTNLGNTRSGILISNSAADSIVGYSYAGTLTGLAKANYIGYSGASYADITVDGAATATNTSRGNIFSVSATDTSTNMSYTNGAQGGASNTGVTTTATDANLILTLSGLANGTKVDWYELDDSYATTYEGTSTISSNTATLSGSFTEGHTAYYQITLADGTSYPIASAGEIISDDPTGLAGLSVTNSSGNLLISWTAASSSIFDHYEIWYGTDQDDVENRTGTATEWDDSDDADLATATTATTTITDNDVNLSTPGVHYYAKIWAYTTTNGNSTLTTGFYHTGTSGGSTGTSGSVQHEETFFQDSIRQHADEEEEEEEEVVVEEDHEEEEVIVEEEEEEEEIDVDTDHDGLSDKKEIELGTDPSHEDTDRDGLKDGKEVIHYGTNPLSEDTDSDGFSDLYEIINLKTDPRDNCEPGNADASAEELAACVKKLAEKKLKEEEEKQELEEEVALEIDTEKLKKFDDMLDKKISKDYEWVKKHFEQLMEMENMGKAYSNSPQVQKLLDSFVEEPELFIRNGEAITIAMAVFNDSLIESDEVRNASTNSPFIKRGFEAGIINPYVNKSFNSKEYISRANTFRLMFRVSGLKLRKEFGKSLYESFAVKSPVFPDIAEDHPAFGYVLYLQHKGILQGYIGGSFMASDYMERAEFIKMMTLFQQEVESQSK